MVLRPTSISWATERMLRPSTSTLSCRRRYLLSIGRFSLVSRRF
jgi:hypothetical protein